MSDNLHLVPLGKMSATVSQEVASPVRVFLPTVGGQVCVRIARADVKSLSSLRTSVTWPIIIKLDAGDGMVSVEMLKHDFEAFLSLVEKATS